MRRSCSERPSGSKSICSNDSGFYRDDMIDLIEEAQRPFKNALIS
jgi:hypothetical protein